MPLTPSMGDDPHINNHNGHGTTPRTNTNSQAN
ncbi:hypothetical protein BN1723_014240 [Verticillium longisporum]|uniref:Uncharacterized protein n=1 Tax=Verticillium longisporum TaxID=100787 RepID=A0A0G4M4F3_VERLO|nr:hypothetical protein BN1723_014240 [Verticillium longisporum]